jgi:transcription elongation factor GreA
MELITKAGFYMLKEKLAVLQSEIEAGTERIKNARADSAELSENQEFMEAKEEQNRLDAKIIGLQEKISKIRVVDINDYQESLKGEVRFGCTVQVMDCETEEIFNYQIVGVDEVDVGNKELLKISYKSPVGSALLKREVGDITDIIIPRGETELEVLKIEFK